MKSKLFYSVLFFMSAFILFAQEGEFVSNIWYLEKLIIEGEEYFLPQNEEVDQSTLEIDSSNLGFYIDFCYGGMADGLAFPDENNFTIDNFSTPAMSCEMQENSYFQNLYFNFIWDNELPFHYVVTEVTDNLKKLVLTGNDNNQAVYYNASLSVQDTKELHFTIYPNPVEDVIYIESKEIPLKAEIYDISGKVCLLWKINNPTESIDITRLSSGIYFLKATNNNTVKITRIIKN